MFFGLEGKMLSKFCHFIRLTDEYVGCFNSILFKPIILNNDEFKAITKEDLDFFKLDEVKELKERGILVDNQDKDYKAELLLKDYVNDCITGGINLIYIIPSNICNLSCKYCFIGKLDDRFKEEMSFDTIDNIVDKYTTHLLAKNFTKATVVFYGGEPLTAFDKVKYAVSKFVSVKDISWDFAIVTNATLVNKDVIDFFKKYNFSVGISIDGPKEINDKNRIFKKGDYSVYDSIISKINIIRKNNINIGLSITLTDVILNNQEKFLAWLKNLGINDINYNLLHFTKRNRHWKEYYTRAADFLFKSNNFLEPYSIIDDRLQRKVRAFQSKEFKYNDCGAIGGHQLCFSPNGDVCVCHGYWHSGLEKCGNINSDSFDRIMDTDNFKKWQNNLTINKPECLACEAIYICGGGCAMQSKDLFGNQHELDKGFCIHTKKTLKELLKSLI